MSLTILFFVASIICAAYGFFTHKNNFIQLAVLLLVMAAWPIVTFFIPNIFPPGLQWIFQLILFMAVMNFIRSRMSN